MPINYAVVRYIGDPGRNEALNVGIVVWDDHGFRVGVEEEAVARVVRDNPHLERDALAYVEPLLRDQISKLMPFSHDKVQGLLEQLSGFAINLTEPRYTTVDESLRDPLAATLERLVSRVVRPRRRWGGPTDSPVRTLERSLSPLLRSKVLYKNYAFTKSWSGVPRQVHFFADAGANLAVDAIKLSLQRADHIRLRADAEAFKVYDIKRVNEQVQFVVYCAFFEMEALRETNLHARQVIELAGARVFTDIGQAGDFVTRTLTAQRSGPGRGAPIL